MPFVLFVLALAVGSSYLRGGRFSRLAAAPLHVPWLLLLGVGLQATVDVLAAREVLADAGTWGWSMLLLSQLLVVGFLVANRQLPGVTMAVIGLMLNATVMAANGAMPVDPAAIRVLGLEGAAVPLGKHTLMTEATRLPWLADVWPLPPLRSIISVGDVILTAGLIAITHALMTDRSPADRRGRRAAPNDP